jgi:N-acetylglucosamine kinase-like BadF-type ATPase
MTQTNPNRAYLLGVDIGNSKTHALIASRTGEAIGFAEIGCGSYEVLGPEGYTEAMRTVTDLALADAGFSQDRLMGLGFGIAGYDWPSEEPIMEAGIEALGVDAPYAYVNDVTIGLLAGAPAGWGVAVDAGTGNNVRGRAPDGRIGRITGNSARFGEYGGAGELVWRAMIAVSYAWSRRGPKTRLTQMFMEYAEVDTEAKLIETWAMHELLPPPILAKEILQLAAEGDPVARDVIVWNARELGESTNAVIRQLGIQNESFDVVLIGSLFKAGEAYITPLRETVQAFAPGAILTRLTVPPVVGAVLLAAEAARLDPGQIRPTLIKSTAETLTSQTGDALT